MNDEFIFLIGEKRDEHYTPSGNILNREETIRYYFDPSIGNYLKKDTFASERNYLFVRKDSSFHPAREEELGKLTSFIDLIPPASLGNIIDHLCNLIGYNGNNIKVNCSGLGASNMFFLVNEFVLKAVKDESINYKNAARNHLAGSLNVQKAYDIFYGNTFYDAKDFQVTALEFIDGEVLKPGTVSVAYLGEMHGHISNLLQELPLAIKEGLPSLNTSFLFSNMNDPLIDKFLSTYNNDLENIINQDQLVVHGDFRISNILEDSSGNLVLIDLDELHKAPLYLDLAKSAQHIGFSNVMSISEIDEYLYGFKREFKSFELNRKYFKASMQFINTNLYYWGLIRIKSNIGDFFFNKSVMDYMMQRYLFIEEEFKNE